MDRTGDELQDPFDFPVPILIVLAWIVFVPEPRFNCEPVWALPPPLVPRLIVATLIRLVLPVPLARVKIPRMLVPFPIFNVVADAFKLKLLNAERSTVALIFVPPPGFANRHGAIDVQRPAAAWRTVPV